VVGVPEITPVVALSLSPGGSEPEAIENVNVPLPPVAFSAEEYATPTVALPLVPQAPQSRLIDDPAIAIVHVAVSVLPLASVTLAVNV
jgi:hypothetical protein